MNSISSVLLKSVIVPFYRVHAGLLIFVFLVMFGTVESNQLVNYHRTLITGMFTSEIFLLSVCFVWTLYSLKILLYILSLLRQPEYVFLNNLMLIPASKVFSQILPAVFLCFFPVAGYSIFIYFLGFSQHYYASSIGIFVFQVLLCCINAFVIVVFLQTQHRFSWSIEFRLPNTSGKIGFYLSYFLNQEKVALLVSKTFSLALLFIVRAATEPGDDFRILGLTWLFVLLSHTFLVPKVRAFEDRYLTWIKGLPISTAKTCTIYFAFYASLMLPELIFSISMIGNIAELALLVLLSAGILMFIHAYLLKPNRDTEKLSGFLFWLFILSFLAILSKLIIALIIVLGIMACVRVINRYYEYEPVQL